MPLTKAKQHILRIAKDAFARQTGLEILLTGKDPDHQMLKIKGTELRVWVLEGGGPPAIEVLALTRRLQDLHPDLPRQVVVLPQVTAEKADKLRLNAVQFIDTAGNGYINQPPIYIFVKGNKAANLRIAQTAPRAFKQTGLRVLYTLLCNPGLENETYRNIADKTNVALGMVNWIIKDLQTLNFMMEIGSGRKRQLRLVDKERLLDRWITAYAEQLRPKLVLGRFSGPEGWWDQAKLNTEIAQWGGEIAAAKLTGYLKPQIVTLYIDRDNPGAVIIPNRLKKDPQGEVELVARFWKPEAIPPCEGMVHPILVFADLMATGNQRNVETARMIYDKHIVQLVR